MRLFDKVGIIGTGLIGGALGLLIKKKKLAKEVIGIARHKRSLALARRMGAIDKGSLSLHTLKDADLVILATPVNTILKLAPKIASIIKEGCLVTDVGSSKSQIVRSLEKKFTHFVGAHPLAGSEKKGVAYTREGLFNDSVCILTPTKKTGLRDLKRIKKLWEEAGAKVSLLSPAEHDRILAFVSHLAHITAFSLMDVIDNDYLRFAATGLKDATRIAASDSEIWADILLSNRDNLISAIDRFEGSLSRIKGAIKSKDRSKLTLIIRKAKIKREKLA